MGSLTTWWRGWRERRRQYAIDRAVYKAGGGGSPSRQATRDTAYAQNARNASQAAEDATGGNQNS